MDIVYVYFLVLWDSLGGWVFYQNRKEQPYCNTARSGAAEPETLIPKP